MRMPLRIATVFLVPLLLWTPPATACPFCIGAQSTLSERVSRSDLVALTQWVTAEPKSADRPGRTTFEVVHAAKNPGSLQKGARLKLDGYVAANRGDLFLLLGKKETGIDWDEPLPVTETSYQYVLQAPSPETPAQKRLPYFLKFLEYPDETIARDAYVEFANADYRDIAPLAGTFPRRKLRQWLAEPDFSSRRLGLYGMMLGLCGNSQDARLLQKHVTAPAPRDDFRLGIDGIAGGYLLLTGAEGLDVIDREKLRDPDEPTTEIYAVLQALRFMWTYGSAEGERERGGEGATERATTHHRPLSIGKERLRQSMRILLGRPDLADIAITDLARWKDWSIQQRLMKLYDHKDYQIDHVKRAIIGYMIASTRDVPDKADEKPPHVARGLRYLKILREKDPERVKRTERLFGGN